MLAKLASRNVFRQTSAYLIYFITTAFTVALMFAANNILFSDELWSYGDYYAPDMLKNILWGIIITVTLVVGFIICYATSFMLRKRKKEFGTYMLLGIRRSSILLIFVIENLIIGAISFLAGCVLGIGVFYVLNAVICALIGNQLQPMTLSLNSLPMTILQWACIFAVALFIAGIRLGTSKISELIKGKTTEKAWPKLPLLEMVAAIFMFALIVADSVYIVKLINGLTDFTLYYMDALIALPISVSVLVVAIFVFYVCLRSVYLQKMRYKAVIANRGTQTVTFTTNMRSQTENPKPETPQVTVPPTAGTAQTVVRKYRGGALKGSNLFHYRQMSSSINRNAAIMGIIAVLVSFSVIATIVTFSLRVVQIAMIDMPFDVYGHWSARTADEDASYRDTGSPEEAVEEARKYSEISFSHIFETYKAGKVFDYNTYVIALSDYNEIAVALGSIGYEIGENEFIAASTGKEINKESVFLYGESLTLALALTEDEYGMKEIFDLWNNIYLVVPDRVLTPEIRRDHLFYRHLVMNTESYLPPAFLEKFENRYGGYPLKSKFGEIDTINLQFSTVVISAIFLGITFMLMSMALLALKVMSDADLDTKRYAILNMLGVSAAGQRKIMLRQLFVFFAAPLFIPLLMVIPAIITSAYMSTVALGFVHSSIIGIGIVVPLVYLGIYICYFAATYFLSVKSCIKPLEKARIKLLES